MAENDFDGESAGRLSKKGAAFPILRFRRRAEAPLIDADTRGRIAELNYTATAIAGAPEKRALVYLPHGYTPEKEYALLVLLHGIGGDENEWLHSENTPSSHCRAILDAFSAAGEETVVVFPNGRTCPDFKKPEETPQIGSEASLGFYEFDRELRADLLPAVEAQYSVSRDRARRAVAGFSMGGMQALNLGVKCCDLFSSIGGFSCAPTTQCGVLLGLAIRESGQKMQNVYLICGDADEAFSVFTAAKEGLAESAGDLLVQLTAEVAEGCGHDFTVWDRGLEHFLPLAFGRAAETE